MTIFYAAIFIPIRPSEGVKKYNTILEGRYELQETNDLRH